MRALKAGDKVRIPWGLDNVVEGDVLEAWGDASAHVRVALYFDGEDLPVILLLTSSAIDAA